MLAKEHKKSPSPPQIKTNKKDVKPDKKLLTEEDCLKIGKILNKKTNRCNKAKPVKKTIKPANNAMSSSRTRKIDSLIRRNAAKKIQRIAKSFIKRKAVIKPDVKSRFSSPLSHSSSSRIKKLDSLMKRNAAKKIQRLAMPFIKRVSFNIDDRLRIYKIYTKYLSKFKVKQCLNVHKSGDNVEYSLADNKIKIVKKIGTESNYGTIYVSKGTNTGELFRFASKIMTQTKDNKNELAILKKLSDMVMSKKPLIFH